MQENEEGSSRGSEPLYESPRFGKRKRSVAVHGRPLSKLFADQVGFSTRIVSSDGVKGTLSHTSCVQILRDIARECDQHAKELRKAFKDEITLRDTRVRLCFLYMFSEQHPLVVALRKPMLLQARELIQDTQGVVIEKEREIKDLKRKLRRLKETLGM